MFSKEDINSLRIEVTLPYERRKNLVEQFVSKYPLRTLKKFGALQELMFKLKGVLDSIPTIVLKGPSVGLNVSNEKVSLEMGADRSVKISTGEKESIAKKPFGEDNLKLISDDFNFITAGILGILNVESLEAEGYLAVSKDIGRDLRFDTFFIPDFWNKLEESEEKHVSGLQIEIARPLTGMAANHRIRLTSVPKEGKKKEASFNILSEFKLKGPIDIDSMVRDWLEIMNTLFSKLAEAI